jgi:tricarballylate dehydrogenase
MLNALYQTAAKSGVAISYGRTAGSFVPAAGGGWSVRAAGEERPIAARAVIVAAGGAGGDPAWLRAHFGAEAERVAVRGGASSDGLALQRLIESGAKPVGDPAACHLVAVDARGPPFDGGIVTRITAIPHGIVVDRDGVPVEVAGAGARRTHYARWGPEIARAPGGIAFLILDADGLARAAPTAFAPIRAETIVGLARALGLDAAALERAVAAANATTQEPRVAAAPFFALPMRAGLTFVHYGVQVDTAMRVAMRNGQTAETLFAAGMAMAANVLRRGYLAGLGLTLAAVSGRRAGEAAADALR